MSANIFGYTPKQARQGSSEVEKGKDIELSEHAKSLEDKLIPEVAETLAEDHVDEDPKYYEKHSSRKTAAGFPADVAAAAHRCYEWIRENYPDEDAAEYRPLVQEFVHSQSLPFSPEQVLKLLWSEMGVLDQLDPKHSSSDKERLKMDKSEADISDEEFENWLNDLTAEEMADDKAEQEANQPREIDPFEEEVDSFEGKDVALTRKASVSNSLASKMKALKDRYADMDKAKKSGPWTIESSDDGAYLTRTASIYKSAGLPPEICSALADLECRVAENKFQKAEIEAELDDESFFLEDALSQVASKTASRYVRSDLVVDIPTANLVQQVNKAKTIGDKLPQMVQNLSQKDPARAEQAQKYVQWLLSMGNPNQMLEKAVPNIFPSKTVQSYDKGDGMQFTITDADESDAEKLKKILKDKYNLTDVNVRTWRAAMKDIGGMHPLLRSAKRVRTHLAAGMDPRTMTPEQIAKLKGDIAKAMQIKDRLPEVTKNMTPEQASNLRKKVMWLLDMSAHPMLSAPKMTVSAGVDDVRPAFTPCPACAQENHEECEFDLHGGNCECAAEMHQLDRVTPPGEPPKTASLHPLLSGYVEALYCRFEEHATQRKTLASDIRSALEEVESMEGKL